MEQKVKQMYTEYTYPAYNKDKIDNNAPIPTQYSDLMFPEQISYYIYNGNYDFNNYRILVAGVGLGSDLINMGFLLKKYKNTKLVGIDLSPTSLNICRERLKKYNLTNNTELIEMSLLDLEPDVHGTFDCIICIGVLHHLESPSAGLKALNGVLNDEGFMAIMVYGKYGRTGVYQMQDLLKIINNNINDYPTKIMNFKNIYKQLPKNNWFKFGEHLTTDHKVSDEGIIDMLLHCQDRAYTIKELYELINDSGMNIIEFSPENRYKYKYKIDGTNYFGDIIKNYEINELFFGDIIKHSFYISKKKNKKADINNLDNILILVLMTNEDLNGILNYYKINKSSILEINNNLKYEFNNLIQFKKIFWISSKKIRNIKIEMNNIIYTILNNIDNKKTTREIFDIVREELNINFNDSELLEIFKPVYKTFELYDMILLKSSKNNPSFNKIKLKKNI